MNYSVCCICVRVSVYTCV